MQGVYYLYAPNLENNWFPPSSLSIFQLTAGGLEYNSTGQADLATYYPHGAAAQADGKPDYPRRAGPPRTIPHEHRGGHFSRRLRHCSSRRVSRKWPSG